MKITAWRITKPQHVGRAFDGEGARVHGGRFNSKGTSMVYTAGSLSLAALEMLVYLESVEVLSSYVAIPLTFSNSLVEVFPRKKLPKGWRREPAPKAVQEIGDEWAGEARSAVLCIPSALVPQEQNYLVNPMHRNFSRIGIGQPQPFEFDSRLVK